jgi:hypothetical protein
MDYQDFSDDFDLAVKVKEEMSMGNIVVLKGYPYRPVSLTPESITRNFNLPKHRPMEVSGILFTSFLTFILVIKF